MAKGKRLKDEEGTEALPASEDAAEPETAPLLPLVEFEAESGIRCVQFAGFRAWANINGHVKVRTSAAWRSLYASYLGA